MRKKNFKIAVGKYYFNVRNGQQNILIMRSSKKDAVRAYLNYLQVGKNVEWLGRWEGKDYAETSAPALEAA